MIVSFDEADIGHRSTLKSRIRMNDDLLTREVESSIFIVLTGKKALRAFEFLISHLNFLHQLVIFSLAVIYS